MKKALLVAATLSSFLFAKNVSVTYKEYPSNPIKPKAAFTLGTFEDLPKQAKDYVADEPMLKALVKHKNHESCYYNGTSYHQAVSDSVNAIIREATDCEVVTPEYAEYVIVGSMYDQSVGTSVDYDDATSKVKATRQVGLATTFYVMDLKTGDTLYTKLVEMSDRNSAMGANRTTAGGACEDPHKTHTKLSGWVARDFCRQIFCMETTAKIFLDKGKGKEFKAATLTALEGNWDAAVPVWEKFAQEKKTKKDALWNLFQYNYYVKQDFSKAATFMNELYGIKDRKHFKRLLDQANQQVENQKKYNALMM